MHSSPKSSAAGAENSNTSDFWVSSAVAPQLSHQGSQGPAWGSSSSNWGGLCGPWGGRGEQNVFQARKRIQGQTNKVSREREKPVLGQGLEASGRIPSHQPRAFFPGTLRRRGRAEGRLRRLEGPFCTPAGRHPLASEAKSQSPSASAKITAGSPDSRVGWKKALGGSPGKQINPQGRSPAELLFWCCFFRPF